MIILVTARAPIMCTMAASACQGSICATFVFLFLQKYQAYSVSRRHLNLIEAASVAFSRIITVWWRRIHH